MDKNVILSKFSKLNLKVQKHSPEILMGLGIVGTVASAVLACKATLKVNDIIEEKNKTVDAIHSCVEDEIVSFRATMSSSNCYIKNGDSFCDASGTCCCVYSSGISSCHSLSIREVDEDFGIESEFNYNCGLDCGV